MSWVEEEIKEIQRGGIDWLGAPLKVNGKRGPKTDWWIGILSLSEQRQNVLKLALGYHYQGMGEDLKDPLPNDGEFVDMLLKPAKMKQVAWCVAFCSHVYRNTGVEWPIYHVSTWAMIEWAKKEGLIVSEPLPGDVECYLKPRKPGQQIQGHARIVTGWDKVSKVTTGVDGNSADMVRVGRRKNVPERYFIRPKSLGIENKGLIMPTGLLYLDGAPDR
jgi:hypothetical protein